jgi:membrane associated rhomboid family serine protease
VSRSPTLTLIGVFAVVYLFEVFLGLFGVEPTVLALALPLGQRPWTLVTSVYAHGSPGHLLANAVALALLGLFLERATSRFRFHAFFVLTGVLSGLAEVVAGAVLDQRIAVLGASGAIFAVLGYLLAGNRVTDAVLGGFAIPAKVQWLLFLAVAAGITVVTASEGVALVAHFTGLLMGLIAGRAHLLETR